jgi:hypothetical protein
MPSEPLEAEFAFPPALSQAQEDEFRNLELEGPLSRLSTKHTTAVASLADIETDYKLKGVHIVSFEPGTGEDPREWSTRKKWYVFFRSSTPHPFLIYLHRYITATTAYLCLAVAVGSAIVTGEYVFFFCLLTCNSFD